MMIRRFATFAATFLLSTAALAALAVPNPSMDALSGSFRNNISEFPESDAQFAAVDLADARMGVEYKSLSKALKKAAGAVDKLDRAFADNPDYAGEADFFVSLMVITTGVQLGNSANAALVDDLTGGNAIRLAKIVQKNNKVAQTMNQEDSGSKISRAKNRKKQLIVVAKAAKYFEKIIKKYGRNNTPI